MTRPKSLCHHPTLRDLTFYPPHKFFYSMAAAQAAVLLLPLQTKTYAKVKTKYPLINTILKYI